MSVVGVLLVLLGRVVVVCVGGWQAVVCVLVVEFWSIVLCGWVV